MIQFLKRIKLLFYYLTNFYKYKNLDIRSVVSFSVRIEGKKYISLSRRTVIKRYGWLLALKIDENKPKLNIDEGTFIGDFCHIVSVREVIIEKNVTIANNVYISDNIHNYEDITTPIIFQKVNFVNKVIIGEGSWIGENACIIGSKIGKNSVVGANSVVNFDVPDYTVVSGNPARIIRQYNNVTKTWF
jgi:acetyltransferase-like isoleucine patch superfamily enzyme